jgi:uncharacterized protein YbbK (DUF523 family)
MLGGSNLEIRGVWAMGGSDAGLILVSACLLAVNCRYDGRSCREPALRDLAAQGWVVPICPEVAGGLLVPRPCAEIDGAWAGLDGKAVLEGRARVMTFEGADVTAHFVAGARVALELAHRLGIRQAILKSDSPSCGVGQIYGGQFEGTLVRGDGVTAALLKRAGIKAITERDLKKGSTT